MWGLLCKYSLLCLHLLLSQLYSISSSSFNNSSSSVRHLCPLEESWALLQFKNTLSINSSATSIEYSYNRLLGDYCYDPGYPKTDSWKEGSDCCLWDGISCDRYTGHVVSLDLSSSWLLGNVLDDSSLFHLRHLRRLTLACNNFNQSEISSKFGGFSELRHLNLSSSDFSGLVPTEISHLSKLVSLDLSHNYKVKLNQHGFAKLLKNVTDLKHLSLDCVNMSSVVVGSLVNLSSSVISLSLYNCSLQGNLPIEVFLLPFLQQLRLSENRDLTGNLPKSNWSSPLRLLDLSSTNFLGNVPEAIGDLRYVNVLDLSYNSFTGEFPASLSYLEELNYLNLQGNSFSGQFPDVFSNLSKVTYVDASFNNFSGPFPSSVFSLTQLSSIDFSRNQFQGHLPQHVSNLPNLTRIHLGRNFLTGRIPYWLFTLPSLEFIFIQYNNLSGPIEHFQQPSQSLKYIILNNNNIHGPLPDSFTGLVNLKKIDLSFNNLSGIVKSDFFSQLKSLELVYLSYNSQLSITTNRNVSSTLPKLRYFIFSSCNLTEFPFFLKGSGKLKMLVLSDNRISGNVTLQDTETWQSLRSLDLSYNFLTRFEINIPMRNLSFLDLSSNLLQGPLIDPPPSVIFFSVAENKLTGEIPPSLCNFSSISFLELSNNSLSGMIPRCLGNFNHLRVLDLRMNNFHGSIPWTFSNGSKLVTLNLNGNYLEGPLPRSLVNCIKLEVLDVGNNRINDTFPHWLETLPQLQVLIFRSNRFHGPIDRFKTESPFPDLRIVDFSHNDFTGHLPTRLLENFKAMMQGDQSSSGMKYMGNKTYYLDSVILTIKGIDIQLERILTIFTTIDLSNNHFQGPVPVVVGKLKSLKVLNFSHNGLSGQIPSSLGNLTAIESLDLSANKLIGEIPMQLKMLESLSVLNLSHNELYGRIPQGNQLDTFDNSSYIGNLRLCGYPLSQRCGTDDETGLAPTISTKEEDDTWKWFWKIVMIGYGCGLVIGVSMTYIVFLRGSPFWVIKMYERLRQPWRQGKRPRERRRGGQGN